MRQEKRKMQKHYWWQEKSLLVTTPDYDSTPTETAVYGSDDLCLLTPPKPGDLCPFCQKGSLAYDGLFLLTCSKCKKVAEGGCFT